ncbi:MAG: cytochrome c-type biogenesis protein [Bryobacteraceae bacterium]
MKISKFLTMLFLPLLSAPVFAETAELQQARIERLENAVLAPCCYSEPVSRHQSEIAVKMRAEITDWVRQQKSDREILDTYKRLYGTQVLVEPEGAARWWMHIVCWVVLTSGSLAAAWLLKRWHSNPKVGTSPPNIEGRALPDLEDEEPPEKTA